MVLLIPITLPAPILLFSFLLFQLKLPLFLCFPLFSAHNPVFSFQLLLLQFQSLLRFRTYPDIPYLFPHFTLYPFRIATIFFYISCHSQTKSKPIVILQNKIINIIVFRFCLQTQPYTQIAFTLIHVQTIRSKRGLQKIQSTFPILCP